MSNLKEIKFDLHTIIMMMGPTVCGKSHFSKNLCQSLSEQLRSKKINPNVQYISTDDLRKMLIGDNSTSKYSSLMSEVNNQTFDLLYKYLDSVTSFPVNAHFVILDSTGLNQDFRDKIKEIAQKNHYALDLVIFNYDLVEDYHKFVPNDNGSHYIHKTINDQLKKMRQNVLKSMGSGFKNKHYIKKTTTEFSFVINNIDKYQSCLLDSNKKYFIVGDIHECIDEFIELIKKFGFKINNGIIYHGDNTADIEIMCVGDLIDKGNKTKETIEFFYENLQKSKVKINLVFGNHERTVYNLLKGTNRKTSENIYTDDFIEKYFNSYLIFKHDNELTERFFYIVDNMKPFFKFTSQNSFKNRFCSRFGNRFSSRFRNSFKNRFCSRSRNNFRNRPNV